MGRSDFVRFFEDRVVSCEVWARDDIQARLFIEDCKLWAKVLSLAAEDLGEVVLDAKEKISAYVLRFANGKKINSMSSNPDAQAGKRGGRVLDEFALNPDPRKLWSIAYPGITWGGSFEYGSNYSNNRRNKSADQAGGQCGPYPL